MWRSPLVLVCLVLALLTPVRGLYFYLDSVAPKCFYEELPRDTMVVGKFFESCLILRAPMIS